MIYKTKCIMEKNIGYELYDTSFNLSEISTIKIYQRKLRLENQQYPCDFYIVRIAMKNNVIIEIPWYNKKDAVEQFEEITEKWGLIYQTKFVTCDDFKEAK